MSMKFFRPHHVLRAPAGDADDGGAVDRGDDFEPTDDVEDDAPAPAPAAKAEPEDKSLRDAVEEDETDVDPDDPDGKLKDKGKDTRIPASRHKAILERERERRVELETRLAQYEKGQKVAQVNEDLTAAEDSVGKLEKEYNELLADGKIAEATAKMGEIRRTERQIVEQKAALQLAAVESRAIETIRYNTTLDRIESEYPELDEKDESYDKELVAEVLDLQDSFRAKGYTPSVALQRAVKYVMGATTTRQKEVVTTKARVDKTEVAKEVRKEAAVRKNIDAALKQPASTARVGVDSDKMGGGLDAKSVIKMDYKDFNKLDDATLARMRGDEFAG